MTKVRIKDMIRDAEEAVKNAPPEGDAKAKAESRLAFLKEMHEAGFTVNQDGINDVVAAETRKVHDEWEGVVGSPISDTKELMDSISEEDLDNFASASGDSNDDGDGGSDPDGNSSANVLKLMREGLSEKDAELQTLRGELDGAKKQNETFQRTIMGDRVKGNLVSALKAEGLNDRYQSIALRNAQYDALLDDALKGNEPDVERLRDIARELKGESEVWFRQEPDPNLSGIDFTPSAGEIPALTDEQRAEQSTPVF